MWKLRGRDNKFKQWSEYGDFHDIADAGRRVLELEGDPYGSLFLRVYVVPTPSLAKLPTLKFSRASNITATKVSIYWSAAFHKG
jgi:hypothetical protein